MWDNATRTEWVGEDGGNGRVGFNRFITVWGRSVVFVYGPFPPFPSLLGGFNPCE